MQGLIHVKMRRAIFLAGLLAGIIVSSLEPNAATRSFFSPMLGDDRVAFCLQLGDHCGKAAADMWCKSSGFDDASMFQRDEPRTQLFETLHADTGLLCTGEACFGFLLIKCRR